MNGASCALPSSHLTALAAACVPTMPNDTPTIEPIKAIVNVTAKTRFVAVCFFTPRLLSV